MSMGLGKEFWVEIVNFTTGSIEKCIKFMQDNKPETNELWFELRPAVSPLKGTCDEYIVNLVKLAETKKRKK